MALEGKNIRTALQSDHPHLSIIQVKLIQVTSYSNMSSILARLVHYYVVVVHLMFNFKRVVCYHIRLESLHSTHLTNLSADCQQRPRQTGTLNPIVRTLLNTVRDHFLFQ